MSVCRWCACLCAAWAAVPASPASAQPVEAPPGQTTHTQIAKAYACVHPSDVSARPQLQRAPCELPMVQLPLTGPAPGSDPARRWPAYPPKSPDEQWEHVMFWRFPVQPMGPYEVPRHGRR